MMKPLVNILTIAGSDCSGGAGLQADIKTCCALGMNAASVVTAVTAQTFRKVLDVKPIEPFLVELQLKAATEAFPPAAVKTGMIPSACCAKTVAAFLNDNLKDVPIVVDPVIFASAGDSLSGDSLSTASSMATHIFPLATIVTPNLKEALFYLGASTSDYGEPEELANDFLRKFGCRGVLLKGGHCGGDHSVDILVTEDNDGVITTSRFSTLRIPDTDPHGTGCALSSALACALALGLPGKTAVERAKDFITHAIAGSNLLPYPAKGNMLDFSPI